ncbi:unnamed protein product [Sphagnum tenellum]
MRYHEITHKPLMERYEDRVDALEQWHSDPSIYVSFTDLPKIGMNPTSGYDTPLGIYAYPLKEMFGAFEDNAIPFADDREYIQVLQSTKVTELSEYNQGDLERDISRLKEKFGRDRRVLEKANDRLQRYLHQHSSHVSNTGFPNMALWAKQDKENETWAEREASIEELIKKMNQTGETFDFIAYTVWGLEATPGTPAGKMWNITRNLAIIIAGKSPPSMALKNMAKPAIIAWNSILRWLGYQAFSDKKGIGLIHPNEPISAVFLSASAFRHIKTIHNRKKRENPILFRRMSQMTGAVNNINGNDQKEAAFILNEWPKLLTGQGERIKWYGDKFHKNLVEDFPAFMIAILRKDFDRQFPIVMDQLDKHDFFNDSAIVDSVMHIFDTGTATKTVEPSKKYVKTFLKVMLGDFRANDLARALERIAGDDEDQAEAAIATFVVKTVLDCAKCKKSELKNILGDTYWYRLIHLLPEDQLFNGVDDMHDGFIDMARNPAKYIKMS